MNQNARTTKPTSGPAILTHQLRKRILMALADGQSASPSSLARTLAEPIGNISYHVKSLVKVDALSLVATRPVRGALEHVYRANVAVCESCAGSGVRPLDSKQPTD